MKYIYFLVFISFFSCEEKTVKKFYDNNNLREKFTIKNNKMDGEYNSFYKNGSLKEVSFYKEGKKIDSSINYKSDTNKNIIDITYYDRKSELNKIIKYDLNGDIKTLGFENNKFRRAGKWTFYKKMYDSVVEYVDFNSDAYVNQVWLISKSGDTIRTKGNSYKILCNDTVRVNEILRFRITLEEPFYSNHSDIHALIPKKDRTVKDNFENIYTTPLDTFPSLKNDGIPHPEIPKYVLTNHVVEFGMQYETLGKKRIRGVLVEYYKENATRRIERRLFFEKEIFVKSE
jgi:antitoxin component YwqK of YwqJK toxin-antitoxin module